MSSIIELHQYSVNQYTKSILKFIYIVNLICDLACKSINYTNTQNLFFYFYLLLKIYHCYYYRIFLKTCRRSISYMAIEGKKSTRCMLFVFTWLIFIGLVTYPCTSYFWYSLTLNTLFLILLLTK